MSQTRKTALIVVDVQHDFLPGGALAVPDGDHVIWPITTLADDFDVVITSQDWHPDDHCSFEKYGGQWPPHCIQDQEGSRLDPAIDALDAAHRVFKGALPHKEAYSAFHGKDERGRLLVMLLKQEEVTDVTVVGLALDHCVKATAMDAADHLFDTSVDLTATKAITSESGLQTVIDLCRHGVEIVASDDAGLR